jgi:phospholipid-binding lipoprotein MlaA
MQAMRVRSAAIVVGVALLAGCATVTTPTKGDPFESYNRTMFTVNDKIDQLALKPVAKAYVWAVPELVRNSVTNFFSNIGDVYIAANNLAQLKIADGVSDIVRVAMNTVFGVGGLFDVATIAKLPKHEADFGLTLGHYGVPAGPYVVLPLLGPSTVRDTGGTVVDYFGNPLTYVKPDSLSWALYGVNLIDVRANLLGEQYIGLEPGGDDQMLKNGDTISMTQSAVVLENLIGQFLYNKAADSGASKPGAAPSTPSASAPVFPGAASAMGATGASAAGQ